MHIIVDFFFCSSAVDSLIVYLDVLKVQISSFHLSDFPPFYFISYSFKVTYNLGLINSDDLGLLFTKAESWMFPIFPFADLRGGELVVPFSQEISTIWLLSRYFLPHDLSKKANCSEILSHWQETGKFIFTQFRLLFGPLWHSRQKQMKNCSISVIHTIILEVSSSLCLTN